MLLCSAELFLGHALTHNSNTFRGIVSAVGEGFKETFMFLTTAMEKQDILLVADGRSEVARKEIRELLSKLVGDDAFTELWIVYDLETSLRQDVRNPKRKLAWSGQNMETLFVILPQKNKGQRHLVARNLFTKSGESTNFSRSYTGVPFRNLAEIPRLQAEAKANILGPSATGTIAKTRVEREVAERGHPLL